MSKFWIWEFRNLRAISPWETGSLLMEKVKLLIEKGSQPLRNVVKFFIVMGALILRYIFCVYRSCIYVLIHIVNFCQQFFYFLLFDFLFFFFLFRCYILSEEKVYVQCYINCRVGKALLSLSFLLFLSKRTTT